MERWTLSLVSLKETKAIIEFYRYVVQKVAVMPNKSLPKCVDIVLTLGANCKLSAFCSFAAGDMKDGMVYTWFIC